MDSIDVELDGGSVGDKYIVNRRIARSICGELLKASLAKDGTPVAIKRSYKKKVPRDGLEDPSFEKQALERLQAAREHATALAFPSHIVRVLETMEDKDVVVLVLEYCAGGDLCEFLIRHPPCEGGGRNRAIAASLFIQMARAVSEVHSAELSHLDLSLENFLLCSPASPSPSSSPSDSVSEPLITKLSDFGQAREARFAFTLTHSRGQGLVPGKDFYRAPEWNEIREGLLNGSLCAGENVMVDGQKSDIFMLGVALFVLLTGNPPWSVASEKCDPAFLYFKTHGLSALLRHASRKKLPKISPPVIDLLSHMLDPNPASRYCIADVLRHPVCVFASSSPQRARSSPRAASASAKKERHERALSLFEKEGRERTLSEREAEPQIPGDA